MISRLTKVSSQERWISHLRFIINRATLYLRYWLICLFNVPLYIWMFIINSLGRKHPRPLVSLRFTNCIKPPWFRIIRKKRTKCTFHDKTFPELDQSLLEKNLIFVSKSYWPSFICFRSCVLRKNNSFDLIPYRTRIQIRSKGQIGENIEPVIVTCWPIDITHLTESWFWGQIWGKIWVIRG